MKPYQRIVLQRKCNICVVDGNLRDNIMAVLSRRLKNFHDKTFIFNVSDPNTIPNMTLKINYLSIYSVFFIRLIIFYLQILANETARI